MRRRDVLKTMAVGLPAVTALGSHMLFAKAPAASGSIQTLNLIVEGPFLCLLREQGAEILAPRVEQHLYDVNYQTASAGTYRLQGVDGVRSTTGIQYVLPEGGEAFRLSLEQLHLRLNRENTPYFSFVAPLPKRIVAVLSREAEIIDAFGQRRKVMMPTAYAFVYDVAEVHRLRLVGDAEWNPEKSPIRDRTANLAVTTGLPMGVQDPGGAHYRMAVAAQRSYLPGLKLEILDTGTERQTAELAGYPGPEPRASAEDCKMPGIIIPLPTSPQPQAPTAPTPSLNPK